MKKLIIIIIVLFISCQKGSVKGDFLIVHKTKQEYSRNIWVQLNADKTKITAFPSVDINSKYIPTKLINGYYLNGECAGLNWIVTSLTVDT